MLATLPTPTVRPPVDWDASFAKALDQLMSRLALAPLPADEPVSPENVISGAEVDGDDSSDPKIGSTDPMDDNRPTDHELNEIYLLVNGWEPRPNGWYQDPLQDRMVPMSWALGIQDARDFVDSLGE